LFIRVFGRWFSGFRGPCISRAILLKAPVYKGFLQFRALLDLHFPLVFDLFFGRAAFVVDFEVSLMKVATVEVRRRLRGK
jgi:hypothetical protein